MVLLTDTYGKMGFGGGSTPTGTKTITDTSLTDVADYANAQVVDSDLVAGNIKKNVNILGVTGTFEGGGMQYATGSFTLASDFTSTKYDITNVNTIGFTPKIFVLRHTGTNKEGISYSSIITTTEDKPYLRAALIAETSSTKFWYYGDGADVSVGGTPYITISSGLISISVSSGRFRLVSGTFHWYAYA